MDNIISVLFYENQFKKVDVIRFGEILPFENFHILSKDIRMFRRYNFLSVVEKFHASEYIKFAHLDNQGAIIKFDLCKNRYDLNYTKYFSNVHKISKFLYENVILLLKELAFLNQVSISIPYKKYELLVEVDRQMMEPFMNRKILIHKQDENGTVQLVQPDIQLTTFTKNFIKVIKKF